MFYRIRQYSFQQTLKKMYSFVVCFHLSLLPNSASWNPPRTPFRCKSNAPTTELEKMEKRERKIRSRHRRTAGQIVRGQASAVVATKREKNTTESPREENPEL